MAYCLEGVIVMKVMTHLNIEITMTYWKNGSFQYLYASFWKLESRKVSIIHKPSTFEIVMLKTGDGPVSV